MREGSLEVTIAVPPAEVFAYISDLSNAPEWVEEIGAVSRESPGEMGLGSRYRASVAMAGMAGEGALEIVLWEPPQRFAYRGEGGPAAFTATFTCQPEGAGTRLVHHYELELSGMARLLGPAITKAAQSNGRRTLDGLKARLEAQGGG